MAVREICENIYSVGVIDWDRSLFDELVPLPEGTTYNSYLVSGTDKTVLIDTVDPEFEEELITNIARSGVSKLDYIVVNHAEQDHSGSLPVFMELFPKVKILTSEKCKELLMSLHHIPDFRIQVVSDGEKLDIGGKTLEFIMTPWVHWPDTMMTYLHEDKILFSMDMFGAHCATSDLFATDMHTQYIMAKRYVAEIIMPFRTQALEHIKKLNEYEISIIAPSHGAIYDDPKFIIDCYLDWCSSKVSNKVVIPYVSMHGSTKKMVDYLTNLLIEKGVTVKQYNLSKADSGRIAADLVDAATIIIATPTVLFNAHPMAVNMTFLANMLKVKARYIGIIGSFGWGGNTVETLQSMLSNCDAKYLDSIYIKGLPSEDVYMKLQDLSEEIVKNHVNL